MYIYCAKPFLRGFGPHSHPSFEKFLMIHLNEHVWLQTENCSHIQITSSSNSQTKFTSSQIQDRSSWSPSLYDPLRVHWAIKFYNRKRCGQALPLGLWPVHMVGEGSLALPPPTWTSVRKPGLSDVIHHPHTFWEMNENEPSPWR